MSYARINCLLPSKNLVETTLLAAAFVTIHVAAYLDREQDTENNAAITLSLASKILASLHTSAALIKVWENLERAGQHLHPSKYKVLSGTSLIGAFGTLAGVWALADSKTNMILGVANASCNFWGRVFSSAHRNTVASEGILNLNNLDDDLLEQSYTART